jgi:hypothetical protein
MHRTHRLASLLKIEPGEERLIGLLVALYAVLILGVVLVQSMTFGVFLAEYTVKGLPFSYISIAIVASSVAALYIKLAGHVSFSWLLSINVVFLAVVTLLVWLALRSPLYHQAAFILPAWFQLAINLANLAVWSLAASLFDFGQGKRLFPLLGAGNWLANIVGGLLVPVLVKATGAVNLLIPASLSFVAGFFLLRHITGAYLRSQPAGTQAARATSASSQRSSRFLKDRYILLIFAYTILWWVAFFFVDNVFYDRAFAQYSDPDQLAAFVGRLLSLTGIVALISSTLLTSRIIARFGLRVGLLGMPLAVILSLGVLALSGSLGASLFFVFLLGALGKLLNVAFGFSLSQSANAIVYQSLPDSIRPRVQATAESIVQPIAIGIAGLSLLGLTSGLKLGYTGVAYVFLGIGAAWLAVIFLLSRGYLGALTRVITRRRLGDDANVLADPASVSLLKQRLQDSYPAVSIYALNRLEALDPACVLAELPALLRHPAPEVRREALLRVEQGRLSMLLDEVRSQYALETDPGVREYALRALGALGGDKPELLRLLQEAEPSSLRGALTGLLRYADDETARWRMQQLLRSPAVVDRNLALEILGQVDRPEFYADLVAACDSPETSRKASRALAAVGPPALSLIEAAFCDPNAPSERLSCLAAVLGQIGGPRAQELLVSRISSPDVALRSQILGALGQSGYRARDLAAVRPLVESEVEQTAWASAALAGLDDGPRTLLLAAALRAFHAEARSRVLLLLSFALNGDSIGRVREALLSRRASHLSYALEIMDVQLPAGWKKMVMPLLEGLPPAQESQRLGTFFPQARQSALERYQEIIKNDCLPYWLRACAAYAASEGDASMLSTVEKVLVLKSVPMFGQVPDNVLAEVAGLLEEVDVPENETIFKQGDTGDSLYVILDGRVRVHEGERLLDSLGERQVFGEMALLDPEPRMASVTAVEPTRLFRLDQAPFYALMDERPEVATGIIRVLTGRLRERVRDIADLNARLQQAGSLGSINARPLA